MQLCNWDTAKFLFISNNVFDPLIYYSHLLPFSIALLFAFFIFFKGSKQLISKVLSITLAFLSLWIFTDLVTWGTDKPPLTMFFWTIVNMIEPIIYAGILYFVYLFIDQKDIQFRNKFIIGLMLLPTILLSPTTLALKGYDLTNCDRDAIEGPLVYYGYAIEILFILWILALCINRIMRAKDIEERNKILLVSFGSIGFLSTFALGNILGSLFDTYSLIGNYSWTVGQYGILGTPLFVAFLTYLIVKYKAFNIKLLSTQALVFAVGALLVGILFINEVFIIRGVVAFTLIIFLIVAIFLIRSVKKEAETLVKLEKLTATLQTANTRLQELDQQKTEFISLATHQIRGPLAAIKGYASMVLEGDYGEISATVRNALEVMMKSSQALIIVVNDYLDVSRIEQGRMKYDFTDFDMKDLMKTLASEFGPIISSAHLELKVECDETQTYMVHADMGKIKQVLGNLIDNSIKYTPTGSTHLKLERKPDNKILFSIKDTGVGITEKVLPQLFEKFSRAPDAHKNNILGTGLGLFVAKKMIEAHPGARVWAESEGDKKGAQFYVELPGM